MDPVTTPPLTHTPTQPDTLENEPVQGATPSLDSLPEPNSYTTPDDLELLRLVREERRGPGTAILTNGAKSKGASIEWLARDLAIARSRSKHLLISANRGPATPIGVALVKDKLATKQLLEQAGVTTPRGKQVSTAEEAIDFHMQINAPIALKPRSGNTGSGVSVNLTNPDDIKEAFSVAARYGRVIVEESIQHSVEYRCMATAAECVSVTERILPTVVGDGTSTVNALITAKNKERNNIVSTHKRPIPQDAATIRTLAQQNLSLDSVLEAGTRVVVRDVGGLSSGGEPYEKTNLVSDDIKNLAVRATAAIPGLHWAGADIIVDENGQGYVIEVNTNSGISGPAFPLYGQPVDLAGILWRLLQTTTVSLPKTKPARRRLLPPQVSDSLNNDQPAALNQVFLNHLQEQNIPVEAVSTRVTKVTYQGKEMWFRDISSKRDRGSATSTIRRPDYTHRVLASQGINRPDTVLRVNNRRLRQARRSTDAEWVALSGRRRWPGTENLTQVPRHLLTQDLLKDLRWPMIQRFVEGDLYRVIATPHAHLLVLSPHKGRHRDITPAANLAVKAVQAIPHLSIASVDVVIPHKPKAAPIVDGMSLNPTIHPDWWISAGSFNHVWGYLLTDH